MPPGAPRTLRPTRRHPPRKRQPHTHRRRHRLTRHRGRRPRRRCRHGRRTVLPHRPQGNRNPAHRQTTPLGRRQRCHIKGIEHSLNPRQRRLQSQNTADPASANLTVPQRATITNMGAELGVTTSIFPSDQQTLAFLTAQGRTEHFCPIAADPDATYDRTIDIDLATLEPLTAAPSSPGQYQDHCPARLPPHPPSAHRKLHQQQLPRPSMTVAAILKGRTVLPQVELAICPRFPPGNQPARRQRRTIEPYRRRCPTTRIVLADPASAKANRPAPAKSAPEPSTEISKAAPHTADDQVYLVSPETAAAAALTGTLIEPSPAWAKELNIDYPHIDDSTPPPPP